MISTSERLTTSQTFSLQAYQRLREGLMQQAHLFTSVTTESQPSGWSQKVASGDAEHSGISSFVLMRSPALNVLLTAAPVGQPRRRGRCKKAGRKETTAADEYQVTLTFDENAIARFVEQVQSNVASFAPNKHREPRQITSRRTLNQGPAAHLAEAFTAASVRETAAEATPQAAFMLSWAKRLTASPAEPEQQPSATQAPIDHQLKQSQLLNQIITQVRHSQDLPEILESAVNQVRSLISADRLVLHQFEQLEQPEGAAATPASSDLDQTSPAASGEPVRSGSVTYESCLSPEISSVLHASEVACFQPSLPARAGYLMGQPIAVDNVDQRYAHADCLLNFLHQAQVKSKIIAPIIVQDQLWGLLIAHQCRHYRHWQEDEAVFLQQVAEHLAVAVSQAGLYQQLRQQSVSLKSCVIERTQNLHDALAAAESANVTKDEFLSTMSHELRTPLTYIIGMSATLLRWSFGALSDRQRSYLTTINQSGEQLLDLINNILEFAKVEAGRSLLEFSDLSLTQLVNTVADHHQALVKKQGVTLSLASQIAPETDPQSDRFRADDKRLQQIVSNLLHNAIRFTPAGGQIALRVWREPQMVIFQVEDTGIGIPDSQQSILFEKFKQLESPFQRQYSGTGLGLAMTKRLVELHDGSIQVNSKVGKGSTFTVRLPVQRDPQLPRHYQVPSTLEDTAERVILLEDSEESAAIACDMLIAAGYKVLWLIKADQLAAQLDSLRPVMLIANLSLLGQDINAVKAIQLAVTAVNAKVLALVNQQSSPSSPMAHHDILSRPIDPKALLAKVRQLTTQK
ncbi:GAF domain-containing hybrid sensor histidine kinase/response regulator [Leptolyngbya sp. BC1307]|uniref:GAF domain-containing hybrid sensor histidine kinase/response regulator n=1 Tax=Leptolyngbya sp. BC1307 TaxID=2029589 RepID=UPI000EFB1752|nr:GAF domain-containing hybrid sensor histidine kinase/response regulator [Leptolyngbya sp. BC1307]